MASLGQKMKNLCSDLQKHQVSALERAYSRQPDLDMKGRQSTTRFFNSCLTNGHTPTWCRKKIRVGEIKRVQNRMTAEKRMTLTNDFSKHRGPSHGSGELNYNKTGSRNQIRRDINDAQQSTYGRATQFYPRNNWVIPLERICSILVVGVQLIDTRISLLTEMTTLTAATLLPEPQRDEPGKILEPIRVLFLVQNGFPTKSTVSVFMV